MKELVIDISHWDDGIDLSTWIEKRNLWGVIIKAGGNETNLGRYTDPKFEENYQAARYFGLHIGFYYYTVTTDIANANADANHFADIVGDRFYDLPLYMDVEDPGQFELSQRALTDVIKNFCDTLQYRGYYAGLYTGGNAWLNNMYSDELTCYANWIASWKDTWPDEAGDIGMWQQGCGNLEGGIIFEDAGLEGYHDIDWCVIDYPSRITNTDISFTPNSNIPESPTQTELLGRASDVINAAYGELGYYAPDDPEPGSKYGRWMAQLLGEDWLAGPSESVWWCCMFVSWCLNQAGVEMPGFPSYNTDVTLNTGGSDFAVDIQDVRYGDIVIFDWNWDGATDHIGFATGEFDGDGFPTIEGNIGNAVQECYRQLGNVAYVLRPPYSAYGVHGDNTPSVDTGPKNNRDGGTLDIDGIGGWNTIIDWQNQLRVIEDGRISGQDISNKEYHWAIYNVDYDETGSQLVMTVQSIVGADIDGQWGMGTSKDIQRWLNDHGYPLEIDGYFGTESVKALQQSLNDKKWKV